MPQVNINVPEGMALVHVTWKGVGADLPDPVLRDATPADVVRMAQESIRAGFVGMPADPTADLTGLVAEPVAPSEVMPVPRFIVRPDTSLGSDGDEDLDDEDEDFVVDENDRDEVDENDEDEDEDEEDGA